MNPKELNDGGIKWYLLNDYPVLLQKLLGEWHYWDDRDGWHKLTELVLIQQKPCNLNGYNK